MKSVSLFEAKKFAFMSSVKFSLLSPLSHRIPALLFSHRLPVSILVHRIRAFLPCREIRTSLRSRKFWVPMLVHRTLTVSPFLVYHRIFVPCRGTHVFPATLISYCIILMSSLVSCNACKLMNYFYCCMFLLQRLQVN